MNKTRRIPKVVDEAIDAFIARYSPTLMALAHGDEGHKIKWPTPDRAECSCGAISESAGKP